MNIGVIFAGGIGRRMHSKEKPKQFLIYNKCGRMNWLLSNIVNETVTICDEDHITFQRYENTGD